MSEMIQNPSERLDALNTFCRQLIEGGNGKQLVAQYKPYIDTVTPIEAMLVLDRLLADGMPLPLVKQNTGKIINLFYKSIHATQWAKPGEGHFITYLMRENREVEKIMDGMKHINKLLFKCRPDELPNYAAQLKVLLNKLREYELHYIKKENILFPLLEQTFAQHRCLHIMWSFHDDFRRGLKAIDQLLSADTIDREALASQIGDLFFVVLPLIFREEQIVFPVALRAGPQKSWADMLAQSAEIGWCYHIEPQIVDTETTETVFPTGTVNLGTGSLTGEQLTLMLNMLPVDITFVDENDEVRYFSGGTHRIFPRSKAIIGRRVQNCHPPESVHVVNAIVDAFKDGSKDHADFWIEMKGRFIHIRYFALRDETGKYKGTIEVSQDATEIRGLQGQRRLLDW
jgi:DUF438 domain-containing protein